MEFKFKLNKRKPSWFGSISSVSTGRRPFYKFVIELNADLGDESTFAIASNKKEYKQLKTSEFDIVYHQPRRRFFFNANGVRKGWGKRGSGGLIGKVIGKPKPVVSLDNVIIKPYSEKTQIIEIKSPPEIVDIKTKYLK